MKFSVSLLMLRKDKRYICLRISLLHVSLGGILQELLPWPFLSSVYSCVSVWL